MAHHHTSRNLFDRSSPLHDPEGAPMHPDDATALRAWIIAKQRNVKDIPYTGTFPDPW